MKLLRVAGALISMGQPPVAWVQERTWNWHWEMHPMWGMLGAWAVGLLILVLLVWALLSLAPLILAIIGAVLGIRWLARAPDRTRSDPALTILRERYARGEIGKDEFDAKMRDLMQRKSGA